LLPAVAWHEAYRRNRRACVIGVAKGEVGLGFLITARDVLARLQAAGSIRNPIPDACRDNPIPQRLARVRGGSVPRRLTPEPKTSGTLRAYPRRTAVEPAPGGR
jgi:hypothetical protein